MPKPRYWITTHWPLNGFIYPDKAPDRIETPHLVLASSNLRLERKSRIGSDFLKGIALEDKPRKTVASSRPGKRSNDPIGEIIARVG